MSSSGRILSDSRTAPVVLSEPKRDCEEGRDTSRQPSSTYDVQTEPRTGRMLSSTLPKTGAAPARPMAAPEKMKSEDERIVARWMSLVQ